MSVAPAAGGALSEWGYLYGSLQLAICWTETNDPTQGDPKKGRRGWPNTPRFPDGPFAAAAFAHYGSHRNPAVVLRGSGLIGIDCDTEQRLEEVRELGLPHTVTVRSSEPWKLHYWFRPPGGHVAEFCSFRFEDAGVTADRDRLLLVPPAIHPSGTLYSFVRSPADTPIAVMPQVTYDELVRRAARDDQRLSSRLREDPTAKIPAGQRRDRIFRYACMQRRWTASEDLILTVCLAFNEAMCEPPLPRDQVAHQVAGAMRKPGGQELKTHKPRVLRLGPAGQRSDR